MVADALRESAGAQIGLQNIGGFEQLLARGAITRGAVFDIMPFQNTLVK